MKKQTRAGQQLRQSILCVFSAFLVALTSAQGQTYSVRATAPHQARAINASGQVAGSDSFDGSTTHAALYSDFQLTDLGTLGGDFSEALAINASGQVVGNSTLPNGLTHATLWSNGQIVDLGTLPGGTTSYATGINDAGQITGWSDTLQSGTSSPRADHAFIHENGQMTDLGNISATGEFANFSHGTAINASGEVTGWSVTDSLETHAFLFSGGAMSDLGTLGGSESRGNAINDAGQVVGWSYLPNDSAAHAFLVNGAPMMDLGTVSGSSNSYGLGINASGTIIGNSSASDGGGPFVGSVESGLVNLNTSIDTFLQIVTRAIAINDAGQILADGTTDNFVEEEFLLTPSHPFANISARLQVGASDNVLIAGFIIQGPTGSTKQVVVRGIGPSLAGSGIANSLANPTLELRDAGGALIAVNDNWKDTQQDEIMATQLAPADDLESATIQTLPPGAYTAIVRGVDGGTGVGLGEVYDLDQASTASAVNVSTRGLAGVGDDVLIGGIIVTGMDSVKIVARAIGPSLGNLGVTGFLLDPTLELHDANGNVTRNDNWRDTQQDELLADRLAPTDDRESAIAATLQPGAYTAIVSGANNTRGVALIEFYQLP
jgi:probable HAF family extracellular repeat protein